MAVRVAVLYRRGKPAAGKGLAQSKRTSMSWRAVSTGGNRKKAEAKLPELVDSHTPEDPCMLVLEQTAKYSIVVLRT